jgi:hypothetical protein
MSKSYICACGDVEWTKEDYMKHRDVCEEYPLDEDEIAERKDRGAK